MDAPGKDPVVEKRPDRLSPRISALARKDREQIQRDRELKTREADIAKREAAFKEAGDDPFAWAEKNLGITYEGWTERVLKGGKAEPKDPAKVAVEKVEQLQKQLDEQKQREAEARQQAVYESEIAKFRTGVSDEITKNEAFELCRLMGADAIDQVQEVVRLHAVNTGELLPLAEAISLVEGHYEEHASTLLKAKKIAAKLSTPAVPEPTPAPAAKSPSPTLTAKDAPSSTPDATPRRKNEKDAEWKALTRKFQGQVFRPKAK